MLIDLLPWAAFLAFIGGMLGLDLGVFHRDAHEVRRRGALVFNYGFYLYALNTFPTDPRLLAIPGFDPGAAARQTGLEFLTGYIVEKSLAVDNIFVFVVVFTFFAIPAKYQHRVLFYGIIGALLFRAIFIAMGSVLMQYKWVVVIFGAFLILTGVKMFFAPEKGIHPDKNPAALAQRGGFVVALVTDWCTTCSRQEVILAALLVEPRFRDLTVFIADFDREVDLRRRLRVVTQGTLVVFKDGKEVARSTGQTEKEAIAELFARAQ